ncbi:hypothetical protein [Hymenobacter convexus]|uniref:hypothetical protein n=1 Tax=Hymenobacter sp. CA1UV-4 TaxID=3063782 RepID=UPI00271447A6|nr:hypothetical protein [Hymenobacter sp. CA1UV-4]MDO7851989.1 hypothetical protein [Hymenobacter sp. CA1UV-4]
MTKLCWLLLIALIFTSCSANTSADDNSGDTVKRTDNKQRKKVLANALTDTLKVKQWLINVIETYANGNDSGEHMRAAYKGLRRALTDNYYTYKLDAMYLDSDREPPMSKEEFKKKWEGKYNTKYAGFGGFIISTQDNGKIKVTSCNVLSGTEQNASVYRVVIEDLDYKTKFTRDIKVIAQNGSLFIDDIMEYN